MERVDYFAVFGMSRRLGVDVAELEKEFYARSRRLHPDRFASRPVAEQEAALAASSELNDAYRTLKEPITRTQHLLSLEGIEMEEGADDPQGTPREKKPVAPPELLEEAFELNMQLEEMRANKKVGEDDPQLRNDLEGAKANFEGMLAKLQADLQAMWGRWDAALDGGDGGARIAVRDGMVQLADAAQLRAEFGARCERGAGVGRVWQLR